MSGQRDDFELAVSREEFGSARTAPVDPAELDALLARCKDDPPVPDEGILVDNDPRRASTDSVTKTGPHRALQTATPASATVVPGPVVVALDFGTSYSSVSAIINGHSCVLPVDGKGHKALPSVVGIDAEGRAVLGDAARKMRISDPRNVIFAPKRLLGRQFNDPEIEPYLAQMAMTCSEGPYGEIELGARGRRYSVSQLCAPVLYRLKLVASQYLKQDITDIVLTVPVSFDDVRRRALNEAATLAGLRVRCFLDEPSAAVLANRPTFRPSSGPIAVYDFGGGTFDFSVVEVGDKGKLSVLTNAGDTWLGGDDFDAALADAAANGFWRQTGVELRKDVVQWQRLLQRAEGAKRQLSHRRDTTVAMKRAALSARGPLDLNMQVNRDQFAQLTRTLIDRSLETCSTALELCDMRMSDLSAVYMSGGTSYIPSVLDSVARAFGMIPRVAVQPDMAVALGAAVYTSAFRPKSKVAVAPGARV